LKIIIDRIQPFDDISFIGEPEIDYRVNESLRIFMEKGTKTQKVNDAKKKIKELQKQYSDEKFRIVEFYNDDKDEDRKPCVILYETA